MSDYRSNKTNAEIDAILNSATPKGEVGDAPDVLTLQGARSYAEVLSNASLICAGEIIAPHTILGSITIGAEVEVTDAFRLKFGENNPAVTKVVLVDKRVVDGEVDNMDTRYIYSGDYEGCYFVMGNFDGNDTIFGLDAIEGDWVIAQNKRWAKIVTKQREISDLDTIRSGAKKGATSVQGVKLNGDTITRKDENGIVDLGNIEGGGGNVSFINNDSLQGLPFGYIGGYYRSYELDGVSSEEVNLGYIDNYYYDAIAIAYDDRLYEEKIRDLKGDGKVLGTVIVRVDDSYNLYVKQIAPKKTTFGWRIYTDKTLMPDSWVDLKNYYTKEEVNRSVGDLEEYTNEELNKKVGKGDIIPTESIGVLSNAASGSATSNPIIGNRIPYLKADAFAFLNPDEYTIEYSVDGVDWETADSNTIYSRSLFAGYNFYNSVPIDPSQRQFQDGSKIRITMYPKNARNAHIDVIAINMYCNGRIFDIEGEYCAKSNDTPQWQSMQRTVSANANGVVYFQYNNKFAFEAYQRWGIRLTFTITKNTAYSSRIQGIMGYGNICSEILPSVSTAPYTLGTLWFWDYLKNITFPAAISATTLFLTGGNSANLLRGNGEQIAPIALTLDFTQLDWYKANTQSISNGMWQVLAPYIPTTKGNRLAFLGDEEFKVEYSTDRGVTWSEMEKTSAMRNVFSGRNNGNITVKSTTTDQMRITITPNSNRYCLIDFFYFWVGSPSEGNTLMDVEFSTGNAPDTWSLHVKDVDLRGLTGANMVKYKRLFAHGSTGVANVRFTIRNTKDHNTNTTIQGISGYGTKVWGNMSNMFLTGDIYSWDSEQNALFPAKIKEGNKWLDEKYALKSEVEVQSDWLEDNSNSKAFIKNKPTMPTQIATATEVIAVDGIPAQMLPNVVYEVRENIKNFTLPQLVAGEENVRNVWKLIAYILQENVISYPLTIKWRNGITPTIDAAAFVEFTFTSIAGRNDILGEWKVYK